MHEWRSLIPQSNYYYQIYHNGRHTQKAKPVQGISHKKEHCNYKIQQTKIRLQNYTVVQKHQLTYTGKMNAGRILGLDHV